MARKKKTEEKVIETIIGNEVIVTLGGCSLYKKKGKIIDIKRYGARAVYTLDIDGKPYNVNARFCQLIEKSELEEKEEPEEVEEPIEDNGEIDNEN